MKHLIRFNNYNSPDIIEYIRDILTSLADTCHTVTIEPSSYGNRIRFTAAADGLIGIEELQIILQLDNYLRSEGFSQESLFVFKMNKIGRIGDSNKISSLSELLDILNNDISYQVGKISIYYSLPELFYLDTNFRIEL